MVDLMSKQRTVTLSQDAPIWAKRRWKELVEERKAYAPAEMASRLKACIGFNPDWIVTIETEHEECRYA